MPVKAIIFDLDDTLTNNRMLDLESFRYLSSSLGLYVPSMREIQTLRRKGLLAKDIISWMIEKSNKSVSLNVCVKIRKEFLKRSESQRLIKVKPKLRPMLQRLKSKGYVLLIATSRTDAKLLKAFLHRRRLLGFFKDIYISNSEGKSQIYKKILQDIGLHRSECLVVGNASVDLLPALGLGMKAVGIIGSYGIDPDLPRSVEVMRDISELYTYIERCGDCFTSKS